MTHFRRQWFIYWLLGKVGETVSQSAIKVIC